MRKRRRWKLGNNAGWYWPPGGDLTTHTWITFPRGEEMILTQVCGFRDLPEGRRKCILDRYLQPSPAAVETGDLAADHDTP